MGWRTWRTSVPPGLRHCSISARLPPPSSPPLCVAFAGRCSIRKDCRSVDETRCQQTLQVMNTRSAPSFFDLPCPAPLSRRGRRPPQAQKHGSCRSWRQHAEPQSASSVGVVPSEQVGRCATLDRTSAYSDLRHAPVDAPRPCGPRPIVYVFAEPVLRGEDTRSRQTADAAQQAFSRRCGARRDWAHLRGRDVRGDVARRATRVDFRHKVELDRAEKAVRCGSSTLFAVRPVMGAVMSRTAATRYDLEASAKKCRSRAPAPWRR